VRYQSQGPKTKQLFLTSLIVQPTIAYRAASSSVRVCTIAFRCYLRPR